MSTPTLTAEDFIKAIETVFLNLQWNHRDLFFLKKEIKNVLKGTLKESFKVHLKYLRYQVSKSKTNSYSILLDLLTAVEELQEQFKDIFDYNLLLMQLEIWISEEKSNYPFHDFIADTHNARLHLDMSTYNLGYWAVFPGGKLVIREPDGSYYSIKNGVVTRDPLFP